MVILGYVLWSGGFGVHAAIFSPNRKMVNRIFYKVRQRSVFQLLRFVVGYIKLLSDRQACWHIRIEDNQLLDRRLVLLGNLRKKIARFDNINARFGIRRRSL